MGSRRNVNCHACTRKESQENYGETERSSIKQPSFSLRKTVKKVVFFCNLCIGIRVWFHEKYLMKSKIIIYRIQFDILFKIYLLWWNILVTLSDFSSFCMDQFKRTLECIFLSKISAQPEYSTSNKKRINSQIVICTTWKL